jgi:hypothetical protein
MLRPASDFGPARKAEMGKRGYGTTDHGPQTAETLKSGNTEILKAERGREKADGRMKNEEIRRPKTE